MNLLYCIISLSILIFLILRQISIWKLRVFLSPGFYFGILWALGLIGILIFYPTGLLKIEYPTNWDELNILVGYTGLCFIIFTKVGRKSVNENAVDIRYISWGLFLTLSLMLLVAAVSDFIRLGANLNMGAARENLHMNASGRPTWIGYVETTSIPLSIIAGYVIVQYLLSGKRNSGFSYLLLCIPLFSNLIFSVNVGGRVHFVYSFAYYLIGASLALPINTSLKRLKRPLVVFMVSIAFVMTFITMVASQRAEHYSGFVSDKQEYFEAEYSYVSFLYGPIEYMISSYVGYQYRRYDAVDPNQYGMGIYTFNGFINWTLPFSSSIGLGELSIAKVLGVYYDNQETYDFKRPEYNSTHSCYIPIIKDFGFVGAFPAIALLVYISHWLFVNIQRRKSIRIASTFFLYFIFWEYWVKSNYYGTLSSSVLIPLYGFIIIDVLNYILHYKKHKVLNEKDN